MFFGNLRIRFDLDLGRRCRDLSAPGHRSIVAFALSCWVDIVEDGRRYGGCRPALVVVTERLACSFLNNCGGSWIGGQKVASQFPPAIDDGRKRQADHDRSDHGNDLIAPSRGAAIHWIAAPRLGAIRSFPWSLRSWSAWRLRPSSMAGGNWDATFWPPIQLPPQLLRNEQASRSVTTTKAGRQPP